MFKDPVRFIGFLSVVTLPICLVEEGIHLAIKKINDLPSPAEVLGFGIVRVQRSHVHNNENLIEGLFK